MEHRTTSKQRGAATLAQGVLGLVALCLGCHSASGTRETQGLDAGDAAPNEAGANAREDASSLPDAAPDAGSSKEPDASARKDAATAQEPDESDASFDAGADGPSDEPRETRAALIDHALWQLAAVDAVDDRPLDALACVEADIGFGYGYELFVGEDSFFVNTLSCNYLTVEQPSLTEVRKGESIKLRLWHFELTAPEGSEAHVLVRLGEHVLLEDHVPIPSGSELLTARFVAEQDIAAGTPVSLHLHNHGANEYLLIEVSTGEPD